jgi:hypothetical protein
VSVCLSPLPFFLSFSFLAARKSAASSSATCFCYRDVLPYHRPTAIWTSWFETSEMLSPTQSFLLLNCFSQVFCHSNRKANTSQYPVCFFLPPITIFIMCFAYLLSVSLTRLHRSFTAV